MTTLARNVVQILGIQACFITLVGGSPPQFRVLGDYGLPPGFTLLMQELAQVGARLPTLYAFQENRIILHNFPPNDAFYTRLFPRRAWSSEVDVLRLQFLGGNIVSVPLLYHGATLGVFNAYYAFTSPPDIADLSLFTSIAELTAVAIHNARAAALARAYSIAMQKPCGPAFVSIPVDDWDVEAEPVAARRVSFEFAPTRRPCSRLPRP